MNATVREVSWWLVVIGAINWGLIAAADFNLVETILGSLPSLVTIFYILVGLAGLWMLYEKFAKK